MTATGIATEATAAVDVTAAATCTAVGACDSAPARRENSSVGQKIRPASLPRLERTARASVEQEAQCRRCVRSE